MMQRTSNPVLHRLEKSLETGSSSEEIAEALAAAEELGDELPTLLAYRAKERMDADRFLGRRRLLFGVACSVFVFVLPFSAIGLTTVTQLRDANRDGRALQQLMDAEQWDEAREFLDSLDDATRARQQFVQADQMIQQELDLRERRKEEFAELVAQVRANPQAPIDDEIVTRLDELAETTGQRQIAAEIAAKADEQRLMREAGRVDDQTKKFEQLQQAVEHFFAAESKSLSESARSERTRELQRELQQFVSANHLSNPELTAAAKQTAALLGREDKHAKAQSQRERLLDAVTQGVGNVDAYARSAGQFAEAFPGDPMAEDLANLVEHHEVIDRALAWQQVLGEPALLTPEAADSKQSARWIERLDSAKSMEPNHPLQAIASPWRPYYEALARRDAAIKRLRSMFQSELLGRMYIYPDGRGLRYYSDLSPKRDSPTAHVLEYFSDLSLNRNTKNFGARYHQQILPNVRPAGHYEFASKASQVVSGVGVGDFTPTVYRLISQLRALDTETQIDPVFKINLMRQLLAIGIDGSQPLRAGFGDWQSSLQASEFAWDANWIAPDDHDPRITEARQQAKSLLESTGDWQKRATKMGESFRRFRSTRPQPPRWVGWVAREEDRFHALLPSPPPPGKLFVLTLDPSQDQTSLVELAAIETDTLDLPIEVEQAQVVGAPVCVFPSHAPDAS